MEKPTCLIVGAGGGNGLSIARIFGIKGYKVILAARRAAEIERFAGDLESQGIEASSEVIDAADPQGVRDAVARLGPVEVLVYNASALTMAQPTSLSLAQFAADLNVNVISALAAAQAVAPGMIAARKGTILLTGGGSALHPSAAMASLGVGKAAIRNLAFALAEELQPKGIRVATVTIQGFIKPGTPFDPDKIAPVFWQLHQDRGNTLGVEVKFAGA
jgi:short-subunit dehydrogenase